MGLGLDGVERGDGKRFDGLGRLSGGFRASLDAADSDATQELCKEVRKMRQEDSKRRQVRKSIQPKTHHDVFFPATTHPTGGRAQSHDAQEKMAQRLGRRRSVASPTPPHSSMRLHRCQLKRDISRSTTSTEIKRAANVERRASVSLQGKVTWRP